MHVFFTHKSTCTSAPDSPCFRQGLGPTSELGSVSGDTWCTPNLCNVLSRKQKICAHPPDGKGYPVALDGPDPWSPPVHKVDNHRANGASHSPSVVVVCLQHLCDQKQATEENRQFVGICSGVGLPSSSACRGMLTSVF